MAIQQWTIIGLVGPAADDAEIRFRRWCAARRSKDSVLYTPGDWPVSTRRAVSNYLARLKSSRFELPVAYLSEHIDRWSSAGMIDSLLPVSSRFVLHETGELRCYRLPDRGRLVRRNKLRIVSAEFAEARWLAARLVEAAQAIKDLGGEATNMVNRNSISPSTMDEAM